MTTFLVPHTDGMPLEIADFHVDLVPSPPEVKEKLIRSVEHYISTSSGALKIDYKDAPTGEGHLNIYICRFRNGKYRLHIFGKIKGKDFHTEKEIVQVSSDNLEQLNERIKYVLQRSRNIMRTYYLKANVKSLEDHLMAFLLPIK